MVWALHDIPLDRPITRMSRPALLVEAADGQPLGRVGPLKMADVERKDFPDHLIQAVLAIEDRRFYSHFGIDLAGIARAAHRNTAAGEIVEGGSTITQQLVRMRFLDRERTFTRKLREAAAAIQLERRLSKDEILAGYLNGVYIGADAHGIPAGAHLYFGKSVTELTLPEAAMLAGIIRAPSLLNPLRDLQAAQARAAVVLDAMVANGAIDVQTAEAAKSQPATVRTAPEFLPANTWFADWVAQEGAQVTGSSTRSMRVRTTFDPRLQQLAEKAINDVLASQGPRARASQAALVAMRPDGAVLAMVGGRSYRDSQFNRSVEANRHPGSAFKLFVYFAALRKGYALNDVIDAGPVQIKGSDTKMWEPENFGGRQYGRMTLAEAFSNSVNTAAVRLAMDVGLDEVIAAARDLGIDAKLSAVPSLALGAAEVGLLDLTAAFASVRAGRMRVEPWGIAAFGTDHQSRMRTMGPPMAASGQSLGQYQQPLTDLLRLVVQRGTGRAAAFDQFTAGKTGTSQNHRDAWFVGFNEPLVVGVWVGNDDNTPMQGVVGGTLPAMIWKRFVAEATPLVQNGPRVATLPERTIQLVAPRQPSAMTGPGGGLGVVTDGRGEQALCNVDACARKYNSFNASDCTYQPYDRRGRQLCEIGVQSARTPEQVLPPDADRRTRLSRERMQGRIEGGRSDSRDAGDRILRGREPEETTGERVPGGRGPERAEGGERGPDEARARMPGGRRGPPDGARERGPGPGFGPFGFFPFFR
jgi:1A family penicillin-binding protein